jgi:serine-type D-Ala-D-Ala carboxypeptidase (penicillin-binding protein 5/6)
VVSGAPRGLPAILTVIACLVAGTPAQAESPPAPTPPGRAWILVDPADGEVLAAHDQQRELAMASATKLMTAQLVLKELPLGKKVVAPDYDAMALESLMGLKAGERVSVRNLLYGLLIVSGNDAAVALADAVSGSVPAFVREMNSEAKRLGLHHTRYANPIGLDEAGNYSTAHDLSRLAIHLRRNPTFRKIVNTPRARVDGAHPELLVNHNELLDEVPWVNGVKTGFTLDADFVLVGSGTQKGVTLVSVLMGSPSEFERNQGTLDLMRYGFSLYHPEVAAQRGQRVGILHLVAGDPVDVRLVAARTVRVTARTDQRVKLRGGSKTRDEDSVVRGDPVGRAIVTIDGQRRAVVPLVAAKTVEPPAGEEATDWYPWVFVAAGGIVIVIVGLARRRGG